MSTNETKYQPQGRTDQASYDYTDHPEALAMLFSDEQLTEALAEAAEFGENCLLKFDYEEWVPPEAVREAVVIARRNSRW